MERKHMKASTTEMHLDGAWAPARFRVFEPHFHCTVRTGAARLPRKDERDAVAEA